MSATLKSWAYRRAENRLVEAVDCLDCGSPQGTCCRDRHGRIRVTCCQARADFGLPVVRAEFEMRLLLAKFGLLPLDNGLLP